MATLRFRLRTLLIVVTLVSVVIGVFGMRYYRGRLAQLALEFITEKGGQVVHDEANRHVVRVYLEGKSFDDDLLVELTQQMKQLPRLQELDLVRVKISDQGSAILGELKQISEIHVFETEITETGIEELRLLMPGVAIHTEQPDPVATKLASATIYRHAIVAMAGSPIDSRIATGSGDGSIRIWEPDCPEPIQHWSAHEDWVFDLEFSPDGKQLASGGGDNVIRIWDVESQEVLSELVGHTEDVHDVGYTPDGKMLISAGDDMTIRLWDIQQRTEVRVLRGHSKQIPRLSIRPNGHMLASASRDHTVRLWELPSGKPIGVLSAHESDVMTVVFDLSGQLLASADKDGLICVWEVDSLDLIRTLNSNIGGVHDLAFDGNLDTLASGGVSGIQLWNVVSGFSRSSFDQEFVSRVCFESAEGQIASANAAGELQLLNRQTAKVERTFKTLHGARGLGFTDHQ